ncbi:UNVERIFIED_CONTAM: hypothetical protein Scaly_2014000 [Sesamum calycinum]|uniref:GRF-type domain-containing protein n=1 Tax=Sesamum calycinum TaxID=2727403 RepID=A0AAW2N347_9LAMI
MSTISRPIFCHCGKRAMVRTSWTNENPGRRFHSCEDYKTEGCGFFYWEDPPMCARAKVVIPGLLAKCSRYEAKLEEMRRLRRTLQN